MLTTIKFYFTTDLFLYDMYDTSGNRPLSPLDVLSILEDIHGKAALKANIHLRRYQILVLSCHFRARKFGVDI